MFCSWGVVSHKGPSQTASVSLGCFRGFEWHKPSFFFTFLFSFNNGTVKLWGRKQSEKFGSAGYKHMLQIAPLLRALFSECTVLVFQSSAGCRCFGRAKEAIYWTVGRKATDKGPLLPYGCTAFGPRLCQLRSTGNVQKSVKVQHSTSHLGWWSDCNVVSNDQSVCLAG